MQGSFFAKSFFIFLAKLCPYNKKLPSILMRLAAERSSSVGSISLWRKSDDKKLLQLGEIEKKDPIKEFFLTHYMWLKESNRLPVSLIQQSLIAHEVWLPRSWPKKLNLGQNKTKQKVEN